MTHIAKTDSEYLDSTTGLHLNSSRIASPQIRERRHESSSKLENLDREFVRSTKTMWVNMRSEPRYAHVSHGLLRDMRTVQCELRQAAADFPDDDENTVQYFVYGSRLPGIFNLGGDLGLFADSIRRRDRSSLSTYAHACIDVVYGNSIAFDLPIVTIALIQGDALGGGFEWALSFDLIVAERGAKIGLPEILFNLFPGMGAYSFLSRRIGGVQAEKMILSGRVFRAEELHAMGVVDVLAEDGEGELAASAYIAANTRKHHAHQAIYKVRRRVNPIAEQELRGVVEVWVDAALGLSQQDLHKMERLAAAQDRRLRATAPRYGVAAE